MFKIHFKSLIFSILMFALISGAGLVFSACNTHTHAFTDWDITEETCTEDGQKVRVCTDCGFVETVILPAGHKVKIIEGVPAKCEFAGQTDGQICERCGETLLEQTEIPELGHNYGSWTPTGDFDVDKHGGTHYKECSRCHIRQTEDCLYSTEEHPATCDEGGFNIHYCQTCGNRFEHDFTSPLGHMWGELFEYYKDENGVPMHQQVCLRDHTHKNLPEACVADNAKQQVVEKNLHTNGLC